MPSTMSPPVLPRRIRSRPSRRAVPGATALSEARIRPSAPELPPDFPGAAARSLAATALLRSQVWTLPCRTRFVRTGETRAKSTGGRSLVPWGLSRDGERGSTRSASPMSATSSDLHPGRDLAGIARHEGVREAQPVRLGEPALDARDPSDLAREAHLADRDQVLGQRGVARGARPARGRSPGPRRARRASRRRPSRV